MAGALAAAERAAGRELAADVVERMYVLELACAQMAHLVASADACAPAPSRAWRLSLHPASVAELETGTNDAGAVVAQQWRTVAKHAELVRAP